MNHPIDQIEWVEASQLQANEPILDVELAWLAGFIDGEGSIGMSKSRTTKRPIYKACVQLVNTNKRCMEVSADIYRRIGAKSALCVCDRTVKGYYGNEYYLNCARLRDVKMVLEAILPYLVIKGEQARQCLKYVDHRIMINWNGIISSEDGHSRTVRGKGDFAITYTGFEEECYQACRELNKRRAKKIETSN